MVPPRRVLFLPPFTVLLCVACFVRDECKALGENTPGPAEAKRIDFTRDVQPILQSRCVECHGPRSQKGGLRLDRKEDALAGGGSGRVIVPGRPSESILLDYVAGTDPEMVMPPRGERLGKPQVEVLRSWIDQGASWPDRSENSPSNPAEGASRHWAFRPIERPIPPPVKSPNSIRNPIDRFIQAKLDDNDIVPAPDANRATLIRRLSLDLIGLPPSPEDVAAYRADTSAGAYENLVDRYLASPRFGERWGRHWLDLARYADSDGYEKDSPRPNAWRYRDWVIEALNQDIPYDVFTVRQLAGDLIQGASLEEKAATGFHRNTLTNKEGGVDQEEYRIRAVIDRVNTTGTVWLGLTIACAQCHSHKYDPILQREYYGLFAFFNSQEEIDVPIESQAEEGKPGDRKNAGKKPAPQTAFLATMAENPNPPKTNLFIRGDFLRKGDEIRPGTPGILPPIKANGPVPTRLEFARWLVDPENSLTARVAANRVWAQLFGRGIVNTLDDFGTRGEPPSHPELLDWLAREYMALGWSQKSLIRLIVTSATYRQSARARPELLDRDPSNVWLARQNRLRLEAEIVRDSSLFVSGLLTQRIGGPSVHPPQPSGISELTYAGSAKWVDAKGPDRYRRGLYTWFQRTSPFPMLLAFDAPDANVCLVKRERSNTPIQALMLLNDTTFVECARALGRRVVAESDSNFHERIDRLFVLCLGRVPNRDERSALHKPFESFREDLQTHPQDAIALVDVRGPVDSDQADMAAWVLLARTILNLDEFMTRE